MKASNSPKDAKKNTINNNPCRSRGEVPSNRSNICGTKRPSQPMQPFSSKTNQNSTCSPKNLNETTESFRLRPSSPSLSSISINSESILNICPLNSISNELNQANQSTASTLTSLSLNNKSPSYESASDGRAPTDTQSNDLEDSSSIQSQKEAESEIRRTNCV
eukprot:CAMPEP_0205808544 /NCGR_PEP_ID=MMETSP0205-20121125/12510_1 /ASSEMBLY_ACC=CAM_ASM_000278 /TAXON_ID=36767 /ORGANISM="Euplotes focardii, Strain TN1" /LENGTH=162 /DNA_ID=CAMNT_0053084353 /DNA_START=113 /DNA_END=601 /DNA_ORIENTATION=+